ncbi:MAG: molybdenum cofactor biosynthesis protein MoaE [Gammaproteobacteria bacterium]|nr:molybdenum cofactor biosynthesis protein MoaE [Gammaproteobacteria bacterium]MDD9895960.1 molybdenum cofactor biosynthesis protein MoaE [Gammaproteobacteria bacterium]MDD9958625.1 molybdenum cofactor biosynthesis protein MoaE [Gammaproteobacteria bacterium]
MISVQTDDFEIAKEYAQLRITAGDAGAIVTFTGLVREIYDHDNAAGEKIQSLFLEHYPGMTEKSLQTIVTRANDKWDLLATRVIHRVGVLQPSDQIVFVGTASAHRQNAFDAARFIMDFLKSEAPFWKKQVTESSTEWVESRQTDAEAIETWRQD